jgi:FtsP/CotA-like multicopper oxidase with cupredoxin domain
MIATDGGLLPAPVSVNRLLLSPGERAEIVVAMAPGERVDLRSYPPDLGGDFLTERFDGGSDRFDVLQLRAADELQPSADLPGSLTPAPDLVNGLDSLDTTREFVLSGRTING